MARIPRPIASLTISFGLVAIPVKLYSATVSSERIAFHLLRKKDGSRVKEQFVAVADGKLVDRAEMAKGYEFAKGKHVMFSAEELKMLEDATSPALDINEFVPLDSVDPVYFISTYYLLPDKGGTKPYSLLATSLRETSRCAIGQWTSRGKEHVILIRPIEQGLALHQLHFKTEVREFREFGLEVPKISDAEVKLARQLIDQLAAKRFDPNRFVDKHKARIQAEIKKKVQGKEISLDSSLEKRPSNVINLMDALKASLQKRGAEAAKPKRAAKAGGSGGRAGRAS